MKYESPTAYTGQKATEDRWGTVKIADSVEAADTSNNDVVMTPARISGAIQTLVPDATTSVKGKVELSTNAEAQAKTAGTVLTASNLAADGFLQWADVNLTAAEVKALRATPKTLVAAPAAGKTLLLVGALLKLDYGGTNVFTEVDDNLAIKYTNGSGVAVSETIETTGFIDQSADTYTNAIPKADAIVAATGAEAQALVLHNTGGDEIAGNAANDNVLRVRIYYIVQTI